MFGDNMRSRVAMGCGAANGIDLRCRLLAGQLFINKRCRIIRRQCRFEPRRMNQRIGHCRKFGNPVPDEVTGFVLILALFYRIIDADGVDPGDPRLHLALAVMDARLVIDKLARKMQRRTPPVQPEMVAGKAHHHGAHAKGEPARGGKRAHAGINQRIAGLPGLPGQEARGGVWCVLLPLPIGRVKGAEFGLWLILELLDEMTMPMQAAVEAGE